MTRAGSIAGQTVPTGQPKPAEPPTTSASCPAEPAQASSTADSGPAVQPAQSAPALLTPQQAQELADCKAAAQARREALLASAQQCPPAPAQGSNPDAQRRDWSFIDQATSCLWTANHVRKAFAEGRALPTLHFNRDRVLVPTELLEHIAHSKPETPATGPDLPPLPRAPGGKIPADATALERKAWADLAEEATDAVAAFFAGPSTLPDPDLEESEDAVAPTEHTTCP